MSPFRLLFFACLFIFPYLSQANAPVPDEFNGSSLNTSLWTMSAPAGGTTGVANGHALLAVPGGSNHDAFVGGDNSVRILQSISNADFDVTAKFDSTLKGQYMGQGILVVENNTTYLRFEIYSSKSSLLVFASAVKGTSQHVFVDKTISLNGSSVWLQVERNGDTLTFSWSGDGANYTTATNFSQSINITQIGPYAWNYNSNPSTAPALNSTIDAFHNLAGSQSPVIANLSAQAFSTSAAINWTTDEASSSKVAYGLSTSYGSTSSISTLVTSHDISLTNLTCGSTYDYQATSTDTDGQTASSNNSTFTTTSCSGIGGLNSDNFDSPFLNKALWTFVNPLGDGVLTMNGTGATLNVPQGRTHDLWTTGNDAVRLMQSVSNGDFQVQVRFQSDVEIARQDEGILVQQDASNFLRFDVISNGSAVYLFSAGINGGHATVFVNAPINVAQAPIWLQLTRTGDNWVGKWSTDGVNFTVGAAFSYTMAVSSIGPYAGAYGEPASSSPAFTAIVDSFINIANPVSNQDGPDPFRVVTVDANPGTPLVEKTLADIEGTGRLNPVIGLESPAAGIYWYEYPRSGNVSGAWSKHTVVSTGSAYESILPFDVNKDGALDLVASYEPAGSRTFYVVWFENPRGHDGNPAADPWVRHTIGTGLGEDNLIFGDLDGDGKVDVATSAFIYFQNSPTSWSQVQYTGSFRGAALLDIGSGKGRINLVTTSGASPYNAVWYENPRESGKNARTGKWVAHTVGFGFPCGADNCPNGPDVATYNSADLNGDGRMDVIAAESEGVPNKAAPPGGLIWFEAPQDRRNGAWIRHTIDANFIDGHAVRIADMDGNGTPDLVSSEQDQSLFRRVSIFYNDGAGNFTQQILSNAAGHETSVGDVRGTGFFDVLNSGHGFYGAAHPLQLFLNPQAK